MSTVIYAGSTSDMAFSIGHEYDIHKINRESFRQEAALVGLGERVAMQHYDRLADRIDEALDKACETLVSQGFEQAENIKERILFARKEVKSKIRQSKYPTPITAVYLYKIELNGGFIFFLDTKVHIVYSVYITTAHLKRRRDMKILISNTSDSPLYQQIKEQIIDAILKGELVEGEALPSIRTFANDLKVSVLTIRRVYDDLEKEGFVNSQVGIGTFVSTRNVDLLRDSKRRLVEQKMADMIQTAKSLGITQEELNDMMNILYEEA